MSDETLDVINEEPSTSGHKISPLVFESVERLSVPVKIGDQDYILYEASTEAAVMFRNRSASKVRLENGKVAGISDVASVEPFLVGMCLHEVSKEGIPSEKPITEAAARKFKYSIVKKIYETAVRISELDESDSLEVLIKQRDDLNERIQKLKEGTTAAKKD